MFKVNLIRIKFNLKHDADSTVPWKFYRVQIPLLLAIAGDFEDLRFSALPRITLRYDNKDVANKVHVDIKGELIVSPRVECRTLEGERNKVVLLVLLTGTQQQYQIC